jgi:hypothetical protein
MYQIVEAITIRTLSILGNPKLDYLRVVDAYHILYYLYSKFRYEQFHLCLYNFDQNNHRFGPFLDF